MIIQSSASLTDNYDILYDLAHENPEPILITSENGEVDLVVMSFEAFEEWEETIRLRAKLDAARQSEAPT